MVQFRPRRTRLRKLGSPERSAGITTVFRKERRGARVPGRWRPAVTLPIGTRSWPDWRYSNAAKPANSRWNKETPSLRQKFLNAVLRAVFSLNGYIEPRNERDLSSGRSVGRYVSGNLSVSFSRQY